MKILVFRTGEDKMGATQRDSQFSYFKVTNYFGLETRVDLKIKVYKVKDLKMTQLIRIDNAYFDIVKMDDDLTGRFTYLYLQKRGGLDD